MGAERRVTPRWPPHSLRSLLPLNIGIIIPLLQSAGISQVFQILLNTAASPRRTAPPPAFRNTPDSGCLTRFHATQRLLNFRTAVRGVIPEVSIPKLGGGTSSSSSKYPANLCKASAPSRTFPSSENTEDDLRVRFFPARVEIALKAGPELLVNKCVETRSQTSLTLLHLMFNNSFHLS